MYLFVVPGNHSLAFKIKDFVTGLFKRTVIFISFSLHFAGSTSISMYSSAVGTSGKVYVSPNGRKSFTFVLGVFAKVPE